MKRHLLARASLRHLYRHPLQSSLAILGVALGLTVVVAIEIANGSALESFRLSAQSVTGRTTHQIVGDSTGVPETLYSRLRRLEGGVPAAPVIELHLRLADDPTRGLRVLGVDPLADAAFRTHLGGASGPTPDLAALILRRGALLSAAMARQLEVAPGDRLAVQTSGGRQQVEIVALIGVGGDSAATNDLLVVDVGTAQALGKSPGRLTRIDLLVEEGAERQSTLERVALLLPPGLEMIRPEKRSAAAEEMTRAFRLNLRALSLLGLLCGAFLIYNTMTFAVVQRRPFFGILRTLGVTRREIFALVVLEALFTGIAGSLLGLAGGRLLSGALLARVTQTINDLYFALSVQDVEVSPALLLTALGTGVAATVAAALGPAIEATTVAPRAAVDRSELETQMHRAVPRAAALGLLLIAVGVSTLLLPGSSLLAGFVGLFLVLVGMTLLSPLGTLVLMRLLAPLAGAVFGGLGRIATRGVTAALSRTAIAIAALMMAVSVTVGVDIMIRSFRTTVESWLRQVLPADLYLTTPGVLTDRFTTSTASLEPDFVAALRDIAGVEAIDTVRHAGVASSLGRIRLLAYDLTARGRRAFVFQHGDPDLAWQAVESGNAVIVTEPFAFRHRLELGDQFDVHTPSGSLGVAVAGVITDYATEQGRAIIDQTLYARLWGDDNRTAASLWLSTGADSREVTRAARSLAGTNRQITVRSNGELRAESMRVFDRTFVITGVLRLLAIIVAFVGVLAALTALQLERGRELAVLRASGLTPVQLWTLVTSQTGLMGLAAGLFALPVGLAMAGILVHVINRRSFGWTLESTVEPASLLTAIALSVGAALLAGLYPAWRMAKVAPAEALRGE